MNNNVQIFKNYAEFCNREDKTLNGVSQWFLTLHKLTIETLNLVNCEGCWECRDCEYCINCICCMFCKSCENCRGCGLSDNLKDKDEISESTERCKKQLLASQDTQRIKRNREKFFINS